MILQNNTQQRLAPNVEVTPIASAGYVLSMFPSGTGKQLAIFPKEATYKEQNFIARVSTAQVTTSGAFTRLEGFTRVLMLLDGRGMHLQLGPDRKCTLEKRFEKLRFDGSLETRSELIGGLVKDFNLMLGPGADGDLFAYQIGRDDFAINVPGVSRDIQRRHNIRQAVTIICALDGDVHCQEGGMGRSWMINSDDSLKIQQPLYRAEDRDVFVRSAASKATIIVARMWFF